MLNYIFKLRYFKLFTAYASLSLLSACGGSSSTDIPLSEASEFTLNFKALNGAADVNCDTAALGVGPDGAYTVGVADMRFYVSDLMFFDANGSEISVTLDDNDFQLNHEAGTVSLIDFTSIDSGYCDLATTGTARTNTQITGMVDDADAITSVSFKVGVPQAVMQAVIAATDDVSDTPSPLGEMYWSWASGYRHFLINFVTTNDTFTTVAVNSGIHLGSRDCGTTAKALSDQDECAFINTPEVVLDTFDPSVNTVTIDIANIFANMQDSDIITDVWAEYGDDDSVCIDERREENSCVTGQTIGIQCHSAPTQPACVSLFPNFGLDMATGEADNVTNSVFGME